MSHRIISPSLEQRRRNGFTIVELLVVVGMIAVLIALLLPALSKAMRASRAAQCLSNMRQIATGLIMYATDNKGAMPGVEYNAGHWFWSYGYDNRPFIGQILSGGYPAQPPGAPGAGNAAWYSNVGLLCFTGYMQWSPVFYCPGRETSDALSWDGAWYPQGVGMKTSGGYNPGWYIYSGTGDTTTMAGYLTATTNRCSTRSPDFGKAHRLGRAYSDTPLVLDAFWYGEGATQEGHGQGYNIATFDGSARWYPDPGYSYHHVPADYQNGTAGDQPTWPVECIFQGPYGQENAPDVATGASATPLHPGWNFPALSTVTGQNWWAQQGSGSAKINLGSRWVAYWGPNGANATPYDNVNGTSGIPFIEKYLMGWDNAKIAQNTPN